MSFSKSKKNWTGSSSNSDDYEITADVCEVCPPIDIVCVRGRRFAVFVSARSPCLCAILGGCLFRLDSDESSEERCRVPGSRSRLVSQTTFSKNAVVTMEATPLTRPRVKTFARPRQRVGHLVQRPVWFLTMTSYFAHFTNVYSLLRSCKSLSTHDAFRPPPCVASFCLCPHRRTQARHFRTVLAQVRRRCCSLLCHLRMFPHKSMSE